MKIEPTAQPKLYIGIDIHKRSWKVHCATDLFGGKSFAMPPKPKLLQAYVAKHFPGHEVTTAYEAGCCGYYAHRSFEAYGWNSLVAALGRWATYRMRSKLFKRHGSIDKPNGIINIPTPHRYHYELIKIKILYLRNGISAFHRSYCCNTLLIHFSFL